MEIRQLIRDVRRNLAVAMAAFVLCVVAGGAARVPSGQALHRQHPRGRPGRAGRHRHHQQRG